MAESPPAFNMEDWVKSKGEGEDMKRWEDEFVSHYVDAINSRTFPALNLIVVMRPYIDDTDDMIVARRALSFIKRLFQSDVKVIRHDLAVFIEYFCLRLENRDGQRINNAGVDEVLSILLAIAKSGSFAPDNANMMVSAVFFVAESTRYKDEQENIRALMCGLIDTLLRTHAKYISKEFTSDQILRGILAMGSFEKKIPCLEILFRMYAYVANSWKLEQAELDQVWESFIRYFPIDIPKDRTAEQTLSELLIRCIVANEGFAKSAFERLLSMLDGSGDLTANSKAAGLRALQACVAEWSPETVAEFSPKVWDALKFEVWNGEEAMEENSIESSLAVLGLMTQTLSKADDEWSNNNLLYVYVIRIARECRSKFVDSQTRNLETTSKIVYAVARTTPDAFYLLSEAMLPPMLLVWPDLTNTSEKVKLLAGINALLQARLELENENGRIDGSVFESLPNHLQSMRKEFADRRDALLEIFGAIIVGANGMPRNLSGHDSSLVKEAISGFRMIFLIPEYVAVAEKGMIVRELVALTLSFEHATSIHKTVLTSLKTIAAEDPTAFSRVILPSFFEMLPAEFPDHSEGESKQRTFEVLEDLVAISCFPCSRKLGSGEGARNIMPPWFRNFQLTQENLINKLESILARDSQVEYAVIILIVITQLVKLFDQNLQADPSLDWNGYVADKTVGPYNWLLGRLDSHTFVCKTYPDGHPLAAEGRTYKALIDRFEDTRWISTYSKLAGAVLRSATTTSENNYIFLMCDQYSTESNFYKELIGPAINVCAGPADKWSQLILSLEVLAAIKPDETPMKKDDRFLSATKTRLGIKGNCGNMALAMANNILDCSGPLSMEQKSALLDFLQILIAKFYANREKADDGRTIVDRLMTMAAHRRVNDLGLLYQTITYAAAATLCTSETKASAALVQLLVDGLEPSYLDVTMARQVASGFRLLLAPSKVICKENSITAPLLRHTKLYELAVLKLIEKWVSYTEIRNKSKPIDNSEARENILIALAGVFEYQNTQHLLDQIPTPTFISIALSGMSVPHQLTKRTYIRLIRDAIPLIPAQITQWLNGILAQLSERFINNLDSPSDSDTATRVAALECLLALIQGVEYKPLQVFRVKLLQNLDAAKGDVDFAVRAAAQKCRLAWMYKPSE